MSLVSAFSSAVLPILAVMAVGYVLAVWTDLAVESLNAVALYAFLPALVFHNLATTSLGGATLAKLTAGVVAFVAGMWVVGEATGRISGTAEPFRSADVLAGMFPNAGFYGVPLAAFAFGAVGRTTAVIWMSVQSVLMYTLGVYVASRSGGTRSREAVRAVFELPLIYAVAAALVARRVGVVPPESGTAMQTVELVGNAAIPLMLVIVGIQLAHLERTALRDVVVPTGLKLFVAPVVGAAVAGLAAFQNPTVSRTFVVLAATPVAVVPLALTITYSDDSERAGRSASEHLTTTIFATTVASVPVLTALIAVMQAGAVF